MYRILKKSYEQYVYYVEYGISSFKIKVPNQKSNPNLIFVFPIQSISAKTRSDRDKLCHFWSKIKSQESQNKLFSFHSFISCAFNSRRFLLKFFSLKSYSI